ncbi:Tolloid-like protein 1 [Elysia marginata]|uniref:Tolloid-like protein 1 n=1 Tax=Elysia marginata TaxID=1093978 RepID=A0AAV4I9Q4_9GAST|nr:Tolloid-like protein 1 [Elysia marginata]
MKSARDEGVSSSLFVLAIILSLLTTVSGFSECGDYYDVRTDTTGQITSPEYPSMYPTYSKCIWLLRSPGDDYRVRLTLTYQGERYNGSCADYVEVRDGGQYAPLLGTFCDTATNEVVTSGYVYMWIMFKSDGITGSGSVMTATFSAYYNATPSDNTTKPFSDCRSYEFECRNKMCASLSYRCDGWNDCGCKNGCDEDECYSLKITKGVQIGISVAAGVATFLLVALFSFIIEGRNSWSSAVSEATRERETRDLARRRRVTKAFSKFIGSTDNRLSQDNSTANALRAPPPAAANKLTGPLVSLTVQPQNAPAFKVTDMTVTDIDA